MQFRFDPLVAVFTAGLFLPAVYLALIPGEYLDLWRQFPASIAIGGPSAVVMFAALLKTLLYVYKHFAGDPQGERAQRASKVIFTIHMGIAVPILLLILSAVLGRISPTAVSGIRVFFAFLISEFMIFPIIGALYLQDVLRTQREGLAVPLLLSFLSYIVIMFITVSSFVGVDRTVLDVSRLTAWEQAGSRIYFLLIFLVIFVSTPSFWQSLSLYSIDIAPPPVWISGMYVVAVSLFLYYFGHRAPIQAANYPVTVREVDLPVDWFRLATSICITSVAALALTVGAGLVLPDNVTGQALLLLAVLTVVLVFTLRNLTKGVAQP